MDKLEKNLLPVWKNIINKAVVTLNDIEKINEEFGKMFNKIQRQRERLEISRDMWKSKYIKLKNLKTIDLKRKKE